MTTISFSIDALTDVCLLTLLSSGFVAEARVNDTNATSYQMQTACTQNLDMTCFLKFHWKLHRTATLSRVPAPRHIRVLTSHSPLECFLDAGKRNGDIRWSFIYTVLESTAGSASTVVSYYIAVTGRCFIQAVPQGLVVMTSLLCRSINHFLLTGCW